MLNISLFPIKGSVPFHNFPLYINCCSLELYNYIQKVTYNIAKNKKIMKNKRVYEFAIFKRTASWSEKNTFLTFTLKYFPIKKSLRI